MRAAFALVVAASALAACRGLRTNADAGANDKGAVLRSPDGATQRADHEGAVLRGPDGATQSADAGAEPPRERGPEARGPFEIPFRGARKVYYVRAAREGRSRLLANLHGVCNPPGYACGYWVNAASHAGTLVCPEGDSHCPGLAGVPTWKEPFGAMDDDLERAVAAVDAAHPGDIDRDGAVLTGFSLGAYAAVDIVKRHPGRWPYLILTEADVPLDAATLRKAGVRAVALLGGERGSQVAGAKRTVDRLVKQGYPAKMIVMRGAGHHYSADIDALMAEALAFVTSFPEPASPRDDAGAR